MTCTSRLLDLRLLTANGVTTAALVAPSDTSALEAKQRVVTDTGTVYVLGTKLLPKLEGWCYTPDGKLVGSKVVPSKVAETVTIPPPDEVEARKLWDAARRTAAEGETVTVGGIAWLLGAPTLPQVRDWSFGESGELLGTV